MFYINVPLGRHGGDYGTKDIQILHYGIWPWRRILNGARISISNLPENIAWQTHRPEARSPLKSGAWGGRPTCHPQTPPLGGRPTNYNTKLNKILNVTLYFSFLFQKSTQTKNTSVLPGHWSLCPCSWWSSSMSAWSSALRCFTECGRNSGKTETHHLYITLLPLQFQKYCSVVFTVSYLQIPHLPILVIRFQPDHSRRLKYFKWSAFCYIYSVLTHFIFSV